MPTSLIRLNLACLFLFCVRGERPQSAHFHYYYLHYQCQAISLSTLQRRVTIVLRQSFFQTLDEFSHVVKYFFK